MLNFFDYQISLNINPVLLLIALPLIVLLVWYTYKFTIPQTTKLKKGLLIFTRTLALFLILALIFDPTLTKITKDEKRATVPVFVDNSTSIKEKADSAKIFDLLQSLKESENTNYQFLTFGEKVAQLKEDDFDLIKLNEPVTNFENIFSRLNETDDFISSAVIISDGIINDGSSSIYQSENIKFPVYTIGIGDTTKVSDVFISSILNNRFLYKETETLIAAEISNQNLSGKNVTVSLAENNRILESKNIELSESGINRVVFNYTPKEAGRQKLTVRVNQLESEVNTENNLRSKFVEVMKNKLNILVLSGAPSADVSAVVKTINEFEEYNVLKFIEINDKKTVGENLSTKLDSAQIIVMISFPLNSTSQNHINQVASRIKNDNIPTFYLSGSYLEELNIEPISGLLPFVPTKSFNEVYRAQPRIISQTSGILNTDAIDRFETSDLPPIHYANKSYSIKPGAEILATANVNNVETQLPLIISTSKVGNRNVSVIAGNIWRWKVSPKKGNKEFFRNFIRNSIQWLRLKDEKQKFFVQTNKDIYANGETIYLTGELYDDKLEPISDAEIDINFSTSNNSYKLNLSSEGEGIYSGKINIPETGDVDFTAAAKRNDININDFSGKFNIGEVDLENLQTIMQDNYLKLIASNTGGEFSYVDNSFDLINKIENRSKDKIKVTTSSFTFNLLSSEVILIIIIIILSFEWFIRKREGML